MLSKILSISGRPGLYKLISTNQNMNVVESLNDKKRIPVYITEKIVSLGDIAIYTNDDDVPLREVFKSIKEKENGEKVVLPPKSGNKDYFAYFEEVLPNYSKESVYASDVKKIINWYNILVENGIDFEEEEKSEKEVSSETEGKKDGQTNDSDKPVTEDKK
ncbi:MAG: DUF5606 domain-containing protein [Fermentimonas sp.]|jgi:hypothetical protein